MNAREKKLIIVTVLLSAAGSITFWRLKNSAPEPIRNSSADKTPKFDFDIPRIGKLIVRDEKVETGGDSGLAVRNKEVTPAPLIPTMEEPLLPILATLPVPLPETTGTLPPPIAPPVRLPPTPRQPAPPPGASLIYIGFAIDDAGAITAFVETSNGAPTGHYNAREGDFLLGRFQVTRITPAAIELEDMEGSDAGRKQTFPLRK